MSSNSSGGFLRGCLIAFGVFLVVCFLGFIALSTVAGIVTSLGLGAMQIAAGLNHMFGVPNGIATGIIIIAIIAAIVGAIAAVVVVLGLLGLLGNQGLLGI